MQKGNDSYRTIKALVFAIVRRTKGLVDYETVTAEVKKHFPQSKWQKTHWSWYRTQIKNGRFRHLFSKETRANLALGKKNKQAKSNEVKRIGNAILNHVRFVIGVAAKDNPDLRFRLNRWVYSRLLQEDVLDEEAES